MERPEIQTHTVCCVKKSNMSWTNSKVPKDKLLKEETKQTYSFFTHQQQAPLHEVQEVKVNFQPNAAFEDNQWLWNTVLRSSSPQKLLNFWQAVIYFCWFSSLKHKHLSSLCCSSSCSVWIFHHWTDVSSKLISTCWSHEWKCRLRVDHMMFKVGHVTCSVLSHMSRLSLIS